MKKCCSLFLCALMVFGLAGCSQEPSNTNSKADAYTYADTIVWDAEYDVVVAGLVLLVLLQLKQLLKMEQAC